MRDLISREVKSTIIKGRAFNHATGQLEEIAKEVFKVVLSDKAKSELQKALGESYTVLEVDSTTAKSQMMGMTVEEFALVAHPLDEKRRYID